MKFAPSRQSKLKRRRFGAITDPSAANIVATIASNGKL